MTALTAYETNLVKQFAASLPAILQAPAAPARAGKCQFEIHSVEISRGHFAKVVVAFDYDDETRVPTYARAYLQGDIMGGYFREWTEAELTATPAEPVYSTPATWAEAREAVEAGRLFIDGAAVVLEIVTAEPLDTAVIRVALAPAAPYAIICELSALQIF
jgi:hypothetical protein